MHTVKAMRELEQVFLVVRDCQGLSREDKAVIYRTLLRRVDRYIDKSRVPTGQQTTPTRVMGISLRGRILYQLRGNV